ncbi:TPA: hypothetical protein DIS60_02060 [Patescibacteria group bacterium]|nr:hypothetical protein [Patescibacteria group bacterium]
MYVLVLVSLVLAACTGTPPQPPSGTQTPTPTQTPTTTPKVEVVEKTVIVEVTKIIEVTTTPIPPTATPTVASATNTPLPTWTSVPPTVAFTAIPSPWVVNCGANLTPPENGQIFWSNFRQGNKDPYAVVFDPRQGGSPDHPALGWWWQPCLPTGPERKAHDVALILQPGNYRFTGPECRVWLNTDGAKPWEQGLLIIDRQNFLSVEISATLGTNPAESWIGVKCAESWATGFSFEKLP